MELADDGELMARVQEGHIEPLAALFERHHRHVFHFFLGLTSHREHSEDLVQDVFLRVLKYRRSFKRGSSFLPWMFSIARRLHVDHHDPRRRKEVDGTDLDALPCGDEDAHGRLERRSDEALLAQALARLAPRKRELLLLSRDPELSYRDLAILFDCSVDSVKVQVHRALKELRAVFMELKGGAR